MVSPSEIFFAKIDYPALREQKATLLDLIAELEPTAPTTAEDLTGILHLIDAIQDHAVAELIAGEADVFPKGEDA